MKKVILVLAFFAVIQTIYGQKTTKVPLAKEVMSRWFTFKYADETITVQNYRENRENEYLITTFDVNFKPKNSHTLSHNEDLLINVTFNEGIVYFLFQNNRKDELEVDYYVKMVDLDGFGETEKKLLSATENDSKTIKRYMKVRPDDLFGEVLVGDTYTAIFYDIRSDDVKIRTAYVFDETLTQVFKQVKEYSREDRDQRFELVSAFVDDKRENLIILNRRKESNKYMFERINKDGYITKDISFDQDGQRQLLITGDEDGFKCVGFFYNKEKEIDDAIFFAHFSNDLELLSQKNISFSETFADDLSKKQKNRGMLLGLDRILVDDDKNIYVLGEAGRIGVGGRDLDGFSTHYDIPDDVVACKIDKDGTLIWSRVVNKSQKFYFSRYASFRPFLIDNQLHYVFNSEMDMEDVKSDKKSGKGMQPGSGQRFSVYMVSFDDEGNFEHFKLTDKKKDFRYMTTNASLIKDEGLLLFGDRKKDQGFLKIEIQK